MSIFNKVRFGEPPKPAREPRALPRIIPLRQPRMLSGLQQQAFA
jgi:hypothetical protein